MMAMSDRVERVRLADADRVPLIVDTVTALRGCTVDDVFRHDKHAAVTRTRHMCWTVVYRLTDYRMTDIGRLFERDRNTVRAGIHLVLNDPDPLPRIEAEAWSLAAIGRVQRAMREAIRGTIR